MCDVQTFQRVEDLPQGVPFIILKVERNHSLTYLTVLIQCRPSNSQTNGCRQIRWDKKRELIQLALNYGSSEHMYGFVRGRAEMNPQQEKEVAEVSVLAVQQLLKLIYSL